MNDKNDNAPDPTPTTPNFFDWRRAGLIVLFAIVYGLSAYLLYLIVIVQIICAFFLGATNANIQEFSLGLRHYVGEIVDYVSYNSERKPFPFSPWPTSDAASSDVQAP